MNNYIPGLGPYNPKIAIVGEAPALDELKTGKPFTGPSGRFLDSLLKNAGINRDACWVTNVCKYYVPPAPKDAKIPFRVRANQVGIDLVQQIDELRVELGEVKPNIVVALGGTALWSTTGKSKVVEWRGSILSGMNGIKTIGTYHPAHILHQEGEAKGYWTKQVLLFDLKRVLAQSEFREIIRPNRNLTVCRNSAQLYDYIERNKRATRLSVDIEAKNGIPVCIGLATSRSEGICVPLWNDLGDIQISTMSDSELVSIWIMLAELLNSPTIGIIGQNFGYDRDKIRRLGFVINKLVSDTMLKAFVVNPELPKNQAFLTSIYTEEPFYKNETMYESSIENLFIGCARDASVAYEIDEGLSRDITEMGLDKYYDNFILQLHELYLEIENNGMLVDETQRAEFLKKYIEWDERIRYELFQVTGSYLNTTSPKQVAKLLYTDWKIPERKGTGEEVLTQLLNNTVKKEEHRRAISLILESRRVKKSISTYGMALPDFDNRMRTSYFICLETGRSSTQQQEPPIRPEIEYRDENGKKKKKAIGMAFQTITKHGDIGPEVRKIFIPDDGDIFLQADSSQAEARVIFLLAEDYEALEDIDKRDYHALTASWFFGKTEDDYSKRILGYEHPIRFVGKTLRHAGHLGASKKRAAISVNTDARKFGIDITISESFADKALKIFHARQPKIKQVFQKKIIEAIENNRRLVAPVPYGIDADKGGERIFFERYGDELFRQAFSYIPQRTVSENTKAAALRIRRQAKWIKILVESHDALLVSVPKTRKLEAANILRTEFEKPIDFSKCTLERGELVIPCEVEEGMNYYELSKFKFIEIAA